MKKLVLLSLFVLVVTISGKTQSKDSPLGFTKYEGNLSTTKAQSPKTSYTSNDTVLVQDTLHYYLNKHYFKTASTDLSAFPNYTLSSIMANSVSHVGSRFNVPAGETVTVTGLETFAKRTSNLALSTPLRLLLCHIDAQGFPVLPAIDSVQVLVSGTTINKVGGNFATPRTMTTNFAVLCVNGSNASGDDLYLLRTAGTTQTNTTSNVNTKYSDSEGGFDYGFARSNGVFYSTKDFTMHPGFGVGTHYEFMVAPRVEYYIQASQILPSFVVSENDLVTIPDTLCTGTEMIFANTSSKFFEHRMYNLNQFYRKWNLYSPFPTSVATIFSSDSSLNWSFEFYDDGSRPDSRVFLPYVNNGTITAVTGLSYYPYCFTTNEFRARLKLMGAFAKVPQINFTEGFQVCFKTCLTGNKPNLMNFSALKMFPNPVITGKTKLVGLIGNNTIIVYNMLGETVLTKTTEEEEVELNLSDKPNGTYSVKIIGATKSVKIIKVIKQD